MGSLLITLIRSSYLRKSQAVVVVYVDKLLCVHISIDSKEI